MRLGVRVTRESEGGGSMTQAKAEIRRRHHKVAGSQDTASSIIEYLIILAFMSLSAVVTVGQLGETLQESIAESGRIIQGAGVIQCGNWGQPPCP